MSVYPLVGGGHTYAQKEVGKVVRWQTYWKKALVSNSCMPLWGFPGRMGNITFRIFRPDCFREEAQVYVRVHKLKGHGDRQSSVYGSTPTVVTSVVLQMFPVADGMGAGDWGLGAASLRYGCAPYSRLYRGSHPRCRQPCTQGRAEGTGEGQKKKRRKKEMKIGQRLGLGM